MLPNKGVRMLKNLSQSLNFGSKEAIDKVISHFPEKIIEVNGFNINFDDMSPNLFNTLEEIGINGSEYLVKCPPDFTITVKLLDGYRFSLKVKEWTSFPTSGGGKKFTILKIEVNDSLLKFYKHLVPNSNIDVITAEITGCFSDSEFRDTYSLVILANGANKIHDFKGVIG